MMSLTTSNFWTKKKNNLKTCLSGVGKMYVVSVLTRNALTRFYGNQTSSLQPPSLEDYFFQ